MKAMQEVNEVNGKMNVSNQTPGNNKQSISNNNNGSSGQIYPNNEMMLKDQKNGLPNPDQVIVDDSNEMLDKIMSYSER
jgi:hypothetical protein